jgi:hypothetical protein
MSAPETKEYDARQKRILQIVAMLDGQSGPS